MLVFYNGNPDDKDTVERHLLTSEVELQFNKEHAEMTIVPSSKGIHFEFEEDMLLVEDRLSGDDHKEIQSLLKSYHEENTYPSRISKLC